MTLPDAPQTRLVPLSQSALWPDMARHYTEAGPQIWSQIPCMATNNPFLAEQTADLILTCIAELAESGQLTSGEPVIILELGAGLGRFGYHVLKRLHDRGADATQLVYVLSDRVPRNLDFWRQQPQLVPFLRAGLLDFANFDWLENRPLHLSQRAVTLQPSGNPVFLIANYVLDTLPQDYFKVENQLGYLGHIPHSTTVPPHLPGNTYVSMSQLGVTTEYRPWFCPTNPSPRDQVLDYWCREIQEGLLLVPTGGLQGLDLALKLLGERLILIAHDKGFSRHGDLYALQESGFTSHGPVCSFTVDYRSIACFCKIHGGDAHHSDLESTLTPAFFTLGLNLRQLPRTHAWLHARDLAFSPFDLVNLLPDPSMIPLLSFDAILTLLKASRFDPELFVSLAGRLQELLPTEPLAKVNALLSLLPKLEANTYITPVSGDFHLIAGTLYLGLGYGREALEYLFKSLAAKGSNEIICFQIANALLQLGKPKKAELYLLRAIAHNPNNLTARGLLHQAREMIPPKHWARAPMST